MAIENTEGYPLISWRATIIKTKYMNTQRQTGTCRSLSGHAQRHGREVRPSYEIGTSQFSDMKVRRLTRTYGFGGYSIYRYLVSEALYKGEYFLPWCEETARAVASYWNASLEDITRIVDGCVQVGLFNDELYRKHGVLTSAAIQQDYLKLCGMGYIQEEFALSAS